MTKSRCEGEYDRKRNINDAEDKKEAGSSAEPVPLRRERVGRCNEAINRLLQLRVTRKCRLLVTFEAYYRDSSAFHAMELT